MKGKSKKIFKTREKGGRGKGRMETGDWETGRRSEWRLVDGG